MKSSKDQLKAIVDFIRIAKNFKTQSELSVDAGYEEQTLTQAISKKKGHEAVINHLKIVYRDLLKNSIWDSNPDAGGSIKIKQADVGRELSKLIEQNIKLQARVNTMLKTVEVLSATATKRSVSLVSGEMLQAEALEADRLRNEFLKEQK